MCVRATCQTKHFFRACSDCRKHLKIPENTHSNYLKSFPTPQHTHQTRCSHLSGEPPAGIPAGNCLVGESLGLAAPCGRCARGEQQVAAINPSKNSPTGLSALCTTPVSTKRRQSSRRAVGRGGGEQAGQKPGQKACCKSRRSTGAERAVQSRRRWGAPNCSVCAFSAFSAAAAATAAAASSRWAALGLRPTKPKRVPSSLASALPPSPG